MTAPAASADADARAHVDRVVRASGTSFYWAMRLLPADKRRAMFAIYAFCREVDDIADDRGEPADKRARLAAWRGEVDRVYAGRPTQPVARALVEATRRFRLDEADFMALIAGMEMDAAERVRIADEDELALYCDRVAGAVGRLSNRVFGTEPATGDALARSLGQALQLTNILRDLDEDACRDRLYLPQSLIRAHGIAADGPARAVLDDTASADVCERVAADARRHFRDAAELIARCDRRQIRPAVMMMEVYRRTLRRLAMRGWRRWAEPVPVAGWEKLWVAVRYGLI